MEPMKQYSFKLPNNLLQDVENKADIVPVSKIIRALLEKWVKGEVELDHEKRFKQEKATN